MNTLRVFNYFPGLLLTEWRLGQFNDLHLCSTELFTAILRMRVLSYVIPFSFGIFQALNVVPLAVAECSSIFLFNYGQSWLKEDKKITYHSETS